MRYHRAMTPRADLETLTLDLHRGPLEHPCWRSFLHGIRDRLSLSYANLIFRHGGMGRAVAAEFAVGGQDMTTHRLRYRQSFAAIDPFPYHDMAVGCSYRVDELLGTPSPERHPFFRDFLVPAGLARLLSARIVEPSGYTLWFTVCRDADAPDFTAAEQRLVDALLPHFDVALQSFALLERHQVHAEIARHIARRTDLAAITVTADGRIVGTGPSAASPLARSAALHVGGKDILTLADAASRRRLKTAVRRAAADGSSSALMIETEDGRMEILVSPFVAGTAYGDARPDVVVYVRHDREPERGADMRDRLMELFGLTALECEIAQALARGRTMAQLAEDLSLTENTVRSYSKSIYGKLGVRRQVDLVRTLLHSVALFA